MNHRAAIWLEFVAVALCLVMMGSRGTRADDERADVAVLQQRADQQDRHFEATDAAVDRLSTQVGGLAHDLAVQQGEERVAWGVLTVLCSGTVILQFRKRS